MGRALQTDLYEVSMSAAYVREGAARRRGAAELFVRRLPRGRRFLVVAGLEAALDFLEGLRFDEEDVAALAAMPALADSFRVPGFAELLRSFRFRGHVDAMPEGTIAFADEPLLRVEGTLLELTLVETYLLSAVNHATTVASKAARLLLASGGRPVVEFGSRRTHPDAAVDAARAAYLAGCTGTSNLEAGRRYGVPTFGTAAHMWIMAHPTERASFRSWAETYPSGSVYLVDTYDTVEGVRHALAEAGPRLAGVRLDSGDLGALAKEVRAVLDGAGRPDVRIVATGDLEERRIAALVAGGAPIDLFGVGTDLVVSRDEPALGGVYKLVEVDRDGDGACPTAKLSEGKATWPGRKQVFRRLAGGRLGGDVLALAEESAPDGAVPLLAPALRDGRRIAPKEPLSAARARAKEGLASLPPALRELGPGDGGYEVRPSAALEALREKVREEVRHG